jgi:Uma2 family endonuclease
MTAIASTPFAAAIATVPRVIPAPETVADLVHRLGDIPLERIRMQPPPGTATVADLLAWNHSKQGRPCELVDGVLVEKAMSYRAGMLEAHIIANLSIYNREKRLGIVTAGSSEHQLWSGLIRLPDVGYAFWHRFPDGRVPTDPAPLIAPDVAVEVLSPSNTRREMDRKRREYFEAGTQLVWIVDPDQRTVEVDTAPENPTVLHESDTLDGGTILPGFSLPLKELFAELDGGVPPAAS